jgi:uncharacterized phage infection (PIP) family protein YhgE/predicted transcriptional regulator
MHLKNKIAFLENDAALNSFENDIQEKNLGKNQLQEGIPNVDLGINQLKKSITKDDLGINQLKKGITKDDLGINQFTKGITKDDLGINQFTKGITKDDLGIKQINNGITKDDLGIKQFNKGITNDDLGINQLIKGKTKDDLGIKHILEALPELKADKIGVDLIYTVFEKGLLNALEQYIKNGDGQTTVYNFYTDFVEAVEERNSDALKIKESAAKARLEDTHILPLQINLERISILKLQDHLKEFMPSRAPNEVYEKVVFEILQLHNAGKATSAELRHFSGLSKAGYMKHLPKLMKFGLIKKQPPSNYVLTEKANNILLELFGIPKP